MSKKCVVCAFGRMAAVATLAVAGGSVGAWAQGTTGSMSATYTVQQIAELEVTPANPTEDNLVFTAPNTIDAIPTVGTLDQLFGNLGTIKVRTNSAKWDVSMTTNNGGRMLDLTSVACQDVPNVDGWGNPTGGTHQVCDPTGAKYLTWDDDNAVGTPPIDVVLDVAIGVAKQGIALGNTGAADRLYPLLNVLTAGAPSFAAPIKVNSALIPNTEVGIASFAAVSFADVIGGGYGSGGTAPAGAYNQGIYGTNGTNNDGDWTTIETNSTFPKPGVASTASSPGVGPNVDPLTEFFYVNVGITDTVQKQLQDNKGTFTETFNFELVANF